MERTRKDRNQVASNSAQPKDLRLLMDFFDELRKEKKHEFLQNKLIIPDTKVNTIGSNGIASKRNSYANVATFLADIDLLARSYMIHFDNKTPKKCHLAKLFKDECHKVSQTIGKCSDCYEFWVLYKTPKTYFKFVCTKPHLLVFVKVEGFPIWPAKLFSVDDEKKTANIECFGDYEEDDVPFDRCYLYSTEIQRETSSDVKQQRQLDRGYKEVEDHIEIIKQKFGMFVPFPPGITISNLNQHLIDMFPNVYAQSTETNGNLQSLAASAEIQREDEVVFDVPSRSNRANSNWRGNERRNMDIEDNYSDEFESSVKTEIEIGEVMANYYQHDYAYDSADSHSDNSVSTLNENRKRHQSDRSAVMKTRTGAVPMGRAPEGNSSQANGAEVVVLSDADDDDAEKWREYDRITAKLARYEKTLQEMENLKKRKESLRKYLRKNKKN